MNGSGAAGSAIGRLLVNAGAKNLIMVDIMVRYMMEWRV